MLSAAALLVASRRALSQKSVFVSSQRSWLLCARLFGVREKAKIKGRTRCRHPWIIRIIRLWSGTNAVDGRNDGDKLRGRAYSP